MFNTHAMILSLLIVLFHSSMNAQASEPQALDERVKLRVIETLKEISTMRESLAATIDPQKVVVTEETFQQVCPPVGKRLMSWASENGYKARQVSEKNRNPNNAPNSREMKTLKKFAADRTLGVDVVFDRADGVSGHWVAAPITVKSSCLTCHGEKANLPKFVGEKYPNDKAFGFREGDLRGAYFVFVPSRGQKK